MGLMYDVHYSGTIGLAVLHSGCGLEVGPGYGSQPGDGCSSSVVIKLFKCL